MSDSYEASNQWANRPDDERFSSLDEMQAACEQYKQSARQASVDVSALRVEVSGSDLLLVGNQRTPATVTNYSFKQLSRYAGAPPAYLARLPATLAAQNINHGLKRASVDDKATLLLQARSTLEVRAITSESYDRVWNADVLRALRINGVLDTWRVPPARPVRSGQKGTRIATEADILRNQGDFGLSVKVGDLIAPAGLYASDHDMFVFMVNEVDPVFDGQKFLQKGFFLQNSEV